MSTSRAWLWLTLASPLPLACGPKEEALDGDDDDGPATGDDDDDDGCTDDTPCEAYTICDLDEASDTFGTCIVGDRSNAPTEAVPVPLSEDLDNLLRVDAMIAPPGDVDFFVYSSSGEEWVSIRTETDNGRDVLDTYVTVFSPAGSLHARLDNYPTGLVSAPLDTVLYTYLPDAGDYIIQVEDVTTAEPYQDFFEEEDWRGDEASTYSIHVRSAGSAAEPDSAEDPSVGILLDDGGSITALGILIEEPGDVDHVLIETQVAGEPLEVWVQPDRPGSVADAQLDLFDPGDVHVASKRAGAGDDGYLSYFDPAAGVYRLEASDGSGHSGPDAWYVVYVRTYDPGAFHPFFGTNTYQSESGPNDEDGQASQADLTVETTSDGVEYTSYRFEGVLGGDELVVPDVDRFAVEVPAGDYLSVRCFVERFGSLALPIVTLREGTSDRTPKGQGVSPTDTDYYVWDAQVSGSVDVELTTSKAGPLGLGSYYRCVAYVTPFDIDEGS